MKTFRPWVLVLMVLVLTGPSLSGCAQRNAEGRSVVTLLPASFLTTQSLSIYGEQRKQAPVSTDARLTAITNRVTERLVAQAQEHYGKYCRGFAWEVVLFDKPDVQNAWCLPGGKMAVYSGILPVCRTEAGLAAVIGHEMAHALLNHGAERVSQQLAVSAVVAGAGAVMERRHTEASKQEKILMALGLGAQFGVLLPYSRDHEYEADTLGLRLMARAGYDPAEATDLWRRMDALGGAGVPAFFSTHPASASRVRNLERLQAQVRPLLEAAPARHGVGEKL